MDRSFTTGFRSLLFLPLSLGPLLLTPGCIIDADLGNTDTEGSTGGSTGTPTTPTESTGEPPGSVTGSHLNSGPAQIVITEPPDARPSRRLPSRDQSEGRTCSPSDHFSPEARSRISVRRAPFTL